MPAIRFSAAIAMARPGRLEQRLVAILDTKRRRRLAATTAVALCLAAAIAAAIVATLRAQTPQTAVAHSIPQKANPSTKPADLPVTHVVLADGNQVDLLAVSRYPDPQDTWWLPDGSVSPRSYHTDSPQLQTSPDANRYRFLFHVSKPARQPDEISFGFSLPNYQAESYVEPGQIEPNRTLVLFADLPMDLKTVPIRIGLASPWKLAASCDSHLGNIAGTLPPGFALKPAPGDWHHPGITVEHPITGPTADMGTLRVIAVDAEGHEHQTLQWTDTDVTGSPPMRKTAFGFDLPAGDIASYRIELRSHQWTEFTNIALAPTGQPPQTRPSKPSAKIQDLSTPQERAEGKFHWLVEPNQAVAYVVKAELLKSDRDFGTGHGDVYVPPDNRPVEMTGGLTFKGGGAVTEFTAFYPKPHDTPRLWDGGVTDYFGLGSGITYTDRGINYQITHLTSSFVPLAWAQVMRNGHHIGTMFIVIRVAPASEWRTASDVPVPRDALRVPAGAEPAAQPASTRPAVSSGPWRTRLPGGVTVELVGVSPNPSSDHSWWRPDGSPMAHPPAHSPSSAEVGTALAPAYEFAIFVDDVPFAHFGDYVTIDKIQAHPNPFGRDGWLSSSGNWYTRPSLDLKVQPFMHVIVQSFSPSEDHTTIWLGISAGEWKTVADDLTKGKADASSRLGINGTKIDVSFAAPYVAQWNPAVKDHATFIDAAENVPADQQVRVVAILANGKKVFSGVGPQVSDGQVHQITAGFRNVAIKDIKLFRLESRPFQWAEFKNIPLHPVPATAPAGDPSSPQSARKGP
jgi:hypothetical protein